MTKWLAVLISLICSNTAVLANDTLVGHWIGGVDCIGEPKMKLQLIIRSDGGGKLDGEVEFSRGFLKSSFDVSGTAASDNSFTLKPGVQKASALRITPSEIQGELFKFADKDGMRGALRVCKRGIFTAFRALEPEKRTPPPPIAKLREADIQVLTGVVRDGVRTLVERRDRNIHWWNRIEFSIQASRVKQKAKDALLAEVGEAKANLYADALMEELASGPKEFPQGIGRAIQVFDKAGRADWPDKMKQRVYEACREQVRTTLRPVLKRIAALAGSVPASLDGLIEARAALNEVETYRAKLEDAFGALDQENILPPMRRRIAALEADPAILDELRKRLDKIVTEPNPLSTTENFLLRISGYQSPSEPLATIMKDGWKRAAFAEIVIEDGRPGHGPFEPNATDIARHVFELYERENARLSEKRCTPGVITDLWKWSQCGLGEMRLRLKRITRLNCIEEEPKVRYLCYFRQEMTAVNPRTGEPISDYAKTATGSTNARFVRKPPGMEWAGSALGVQ